VKTINGSSLKQMIISGANHLYNNYPEIDALNVFPVPDGDTGMNMNLTVSSGAKEVANRNDTDIYEIAKAFSKGLLMGARGNSGVITSQIFRGFAQALEGKQQINAVEFAEAWISGKDVAYKAVMRPVEGTILTVVREASAILLEKVTTDWSIEKAMEVLLKEARASLERTPELLPILKEVGVVDSGGAGLVKIWEGFERGLKGDIVEKSQATAFEESKAGYAAAQMEGEEYGYCTEFIMELGPDATKKPFVEKRFGNVLNSHGTSIVMVRDGSIVKVHIHTINPGNILSYAQQFGEFVTLKIENMTEQHEKIEKDAQTAKKELFAEAPSDHHRPAPKVEEKKPVIQAKPVTNEKKDYALIAVAAGEGVANMFKELRVDVIVSGGQTMNPATEDFVTAIRSVNAKHIFILPNNPNIIMAASQACDVLEESVDARVIASKTIPQGLVACMMFNPDAEVDENYNAMKKALKGIKSGAVTFSIKDTTVDGIEVKKDYFMGIQDKKIVGCHADKVEAAYHLISTMIDDMSSIVTIISGEDVKSEQTQALVDRLVSEHEDIEFDVRDGGQPVYSFLIGVE